MPHCIFTCARFEPNELAEAVYAVSTGVFCAAHVKQVGDLHTCDELAEFALQHVSRRNSDLLGGSWGPSLFEHPTEPQEYFRLCSEQLPSLAQFYSRLPKQLLDGLQNFHDLAKYCRMEPLSLDGQAAPMFRVLTFPSAEKILLANHEDLANLIAMRGIHPRLAVADAPYVIGHNFYLRNNSGQGTIRIYDWRPSLTEKYGLDRKYESRNLELLRTGYGYPEEEVAHRDFFDIQPEVGDYIIFRSDYVHRVMSDDYSHDMKFKERVSLNGFLAPVILPEYPSFLTYWT